MSIPAAYSYSYKRPWPRPYCGDLGVARRVLWLRADPQALRELRARINLLAAQGYAFTSNTDSLWDVVVAPLPESPEMEYYRDFLKSVEPSRVVQDRDPLAAISRAVAFPRPRFSWMVLAVDSGTSMCGLAALADGLVLEASPAPCGEVGWRVRELASRVPHERLRVVVGNGAGWDELADELLGLGLPVGFVDESGTTAPRLPLPLRLKDSNARAALALALRSLAGEGW